MKRTFNFRCVWCIALLLASLLLLGACASTEPPEVATETDAQTVSLETQVDLETDEAEIPAEENSETEQPAETLPVTGAATEETAEIPTEADTEPATEAETETETQGVDMLYILEPGKSSSNFTVVYDMSLTSAPKAEADRINKGLEAVFDARFRQVDAAIESRKRETEIIIGSVNREECVELTASLAAGEYAVKVYPSEEEGKGRIVIAYTDLLSRTLAVELFMTKCLDELGGCLPMDFEARGSTETDAEQGIIVADISKLRDPCILVVDSVYYAYGTSWKLFKNTSGDLSGPWVQIKNVVEVPEDVDTNKWAPEVHVYNGAYYMFTTYLSKTTGHRGCTIMKSDSPEGPFVEITDGHITPKDWDSIDGTLYIDPDGQPWMVFVHEWTSTKNSIGTFAAAKLSEDFTHFISEPFEMFAANEPSWATAQVTDGCWMYTTEDGELLMIWSNFEPAGYTVAVSRSSNGRLDGEWIHDQALLYSYNYTGEYDGGHAMIFHDLNGQMYLSMHSPNTDTEARKATPTFIPIAEKDGTLVWTYIDAIRQNETITGTFSEE